MSLQIKASLNRSIDQLPHPSFASIASAPIQKLREQDAITRQEPLPSAGKTTLRRVALAFACCMLVSLTGFGFFYQNLAVDSLITIDVNPGFELTANRRDHLLSITALNAEAVELLDGKSFRGWAVNEVVEDLFSKLGESRYMSAQKSTVLLSVRNKDAGHIHQLEKELTSQIEAALSVAKIKPHIVFQALSNDAAMQKEAGQYHVSSGKLQLAQQVKERFPTYPIEKLTTLPLEELLALLGSVAVQAEKPDPEHWEESEPDPPAAAPSQEEREESDEDESDEDKEPEDSSQEEPEEESAPSGPALPSEKEEKEVGDASEKENDVDSASESAEPETDAAEPEENDGADDSDDSDDAEETDES